MAEKYRKCLSCGSRILPDQPVTEIKNTRGKTAGTTRFAHADHRHCAG